MKRRIEVGLESSMVLVDSNDALGRRFKSAKLSK